MLANYANYSKLCAALFPRSRLNDDLGLILRGRIRPSSILYLSRCVIISIFDHNILHFLLLFLFLLDVVHSNIDDFLFYSKVFLERKTDR